MAAPVARHRVSNATARAHALEPRAWLVFAATLVLLTAAAFLGPARARLGGSLWPVPLDDVYIHFGFARSAALGHPFEWIPGNGYSSGATSLTYPFVLAVGWLIGFRGSSLGAFAALVAVVSLVDFARSLRALLTRFVPAPRWVAWLAPPFLLAVPLLDWSFFSGMETALFAAVLGRALVASARALDAPADARSRAQLRAGVWLALLVATRPESLALALPLALAIVHGARSLPTFASLARAGGPTALLLVTQALANRAFTGEWGAAGVVRKLILSNPYESALEMAGEVLRNLAVLRAQAFELPLGGGLFALAVPALALASIADTRTRRLGASLVTGAVLALGLVCFNATARFQNFRYAAPSLVMLLSAAVLGVGALGRRGPRSAAFAAVLAAVALLGPFRGFAPQIKHFSRASANIAEQQVRVAASVRRLGPRRVLVNDAGAIPYLSGAAAIDGLGLGGYHGLPFARASVHGVPAVLELIERLHRDERPDLLALYPGWWAGLVEGFGRVVETVRITDNVICGADGVWVSVADWSALDAPGALRAGASDELDLADLVSERAHDYALPERGGWVIGASLVLADGTRRFDAGRIVPEGARESFVVGPSVARGASTLIFRTDPGPPVALRVGVARHAEALGEFDVNVPARPAGAWFELQVELPDLAAGDRVTVASRSGTWRGFHAWIVPTLPARPFR